MRLVTRLLSLLRSKQTNNTGMKLCAIAKNKAVSVCATVLYRDKK